MKYRVMLSGTAMVDQPPAGMDEADVLDQHFDQVMDRLVELEEGDSTLSDADVSASTATGDIEISIVVDASELGDAAKRGIATIRCAVHAAGGYTPGWEDATGQTWALEDVRSSQEPLALV